MTKIDYPAFEYKMKRAADSELIFDEVRKQWVALTPEEWVRQNFLQYLIQVKKYPATLIAVEKEIKLGDLKKRIDIVVYDKNIQPWMIVECKEMNVAADKKVLAQAMRYHISLPVTFLIITNGSYCFGFEKKNNELSEIDSLPAYPGF